MTVADLSVADIMATSVALTWDPDVGHPVTLFEIHYRQADSSEVLNTGSVDGTAQYFALGGLDPSTEYSVMVITVVTSGGQTESLYTDEVPFTTGIFFMIKCKP